jgi:hypothetical protein
MLKAIFNWFNHKKPAPEAQAPTVTPEAAPYKVEVINSQPLVKEAAPVEAVAETAAAKKPAAIKATKKPAAKKPAAKKPATKKAASKKPAK